MIGTSNKIELNPSTRLGWKCPECHACHSPDVSMCERCAPPYYVQPYSPQTPWWGIHPPNLYPKGQWTIVSGTGTGTSYEAD